MRDPARQLARLIQARQGTRHRPPDLCECRRCRSRYVQPVEVESKPDGRLALLLRCPECQWWGEGTFPAERVREYDRLLSEGREELRAIYRRTLRDNLYRELR